MKRIYEKFNGKKGNQSINKVELKSRDDLLMQKVMNIIKENILEKEIDMEISKAGH